MVRTQNERHLLLIRGMRHGVCAVEEPRLPQRPDSERTKDCLIKNCILKFFAARIDVYDSLPVVKICSISVLLLPRFSARRAKVKKGVRPLFWIKVSLHTLLVHRHPKAGVGGQRGMLLGCKSSGWKRTLGLRPLWNPLPSKICQDRP